MIHFFTETDFDLLDQDFYRDWIHACMDIEDKNVGNVNVIFCDDPYLLAINQQHLNHDFFTDIITFDYSDKKTLNGDIFISIDRVADNSYDYNSGFEQELSRVIIHGFLHLAGYKDKTESQQALMRQKEDECLSLLTHQISEEE